MKFWKKSSICLMLSLCLMACGPSSTDGDKESNTESPSQTIEAVKPFYIYCNDEVTETVLEFFVAENPEYEEKDPGAEAYPDLIVFPYELKDMYLESEHLIPVSKLGIEEEDLAEMYEYMLQYGTDSEGKLKALSWMDAASVFVYRTSLAEEYLQIATPEEMENAISTWVSFAEIAGNLVERTDGAVRILPELKAVKELLYYGNPDSWYPEGSEEFVISDYLMEGIMSYLDLEENLTWNYEAGTDAWYDAMSDGSTLGFFGSSYFVEQILAKECGETAGDWDICRAPSSYEFDGVWVAATKHCADLELAEEIVRYMTMEEVVLEEIAATYHIAVNNKTLMETLSVEESAHSAILGEGGMLFYYLEEGSVLKEEDKELNELFWTEAELYWNDKLNLEQLLVQLEEKIKAME